MFKAFETECSSPFQHVAGVGCMAYVEAAASYSTAQSGCLSSHDSTLYEMQDVSELALVKAHFGLATPGGVWIGLRRVGDDPNFYWEESGKSHPMGNPSDTTNCAKFNDGQLALEASDCETWFYYLCKKQ